MIKSAIAIAAAALSTSAVMFSPAAYAEPVGTSVKLSWNGLDLSTRAGQREFARRTDIAVHTACPDAQVTGSHLMQPSVAACRASVRAQIAQRVAAGSRVALRN